ncbi:MAG: hypothetical protein RL153_482, partial [Verrucomicrobiota bacterium]
SMKSIRPIGSMPSMALVLLLLLALPARAQWVSQSLSLKAGWNAVYLHVDASHQTLQDMVAADPDSPIMEVWLWAPPVSTVQFVTSPQNPLPDNNQWRYWRRNQGDGTLARMVGNAAYLVRVSEDTATHAWTIQGKPLVPSYQWTTTGLNFIGFPTVPTDAPVWENFIAPSPELQLNAEIFHYPGGELGAGNPGRLYALRSTPVTRGQAYWLRSGTVFNRYFAPFEVEATGGGGLVFGDALSAQNFRVRNLTTNVVTMTLNLVASQTPPAGQPPITGVPPLQLRGALNTTNLTYGFTNLSVGTARTVTLAPKGTPGSDVEVVLGLDRSSMTGAEGALFAAVLRLTDSLGFSMVEMPVTARVASTSGLWVGNAEINRVEPYLPALQKLAASAVPVDPAPTLPEGVVEVPREELEANVPRTFPVRLIVHNPGSGNAKLLQQVFYGFDTYTNQVVATSESVLLASYLPQSRRITTSNLPWRAGNAPWAFNGRLGDASTLTTTVETAFDDHASNPFLHTYHPDHDNLDATFKTQVPRGMESYGIRREITLRVLPPSTNVFSLGNSRTMRGWYKETIRLVGLARGGGTSDTRDFMVSGPFTLTRISEVPALTTP